LLRLRESSRYRNEADMAEIYDYAPIFSRASSCEKTENMLYIPLRQTDRRRPEASRSKMEKKECDGPDLLAGARDGADFLFESAVTH
jgi:hypothetical protein